MAVPVITTTDYVFEGIVGSLISPTTFTGTDVDTWTATGLEAVGGLTLNPSSGLLSGTPENNGTFDVTITASNVEGSDTLDIQVHTMLAQAPFGSRPSWVEDRKGVALINTYLASWYIDDAVGGVAELFTRMQDAYVNQGIEVIMTNRPYYTTSPGVGGDVTAAGWYTMPADYQAEYRSNYAAAIASWWDDGLAFIPYYGTRARAEDEVLGWSSGLGTYPGVPPLSAIGDTDALGQSLLNDTVAQWESVGADAHGMDKMSNDVNKTHYINLSETTDSFFIGEAIPQSIDEREYLQRVAWIGITTFYRKNPELWYLGVSYPKSRLYFWWNSSAAEAYPGGLPATEQERLDLGRRFWRRQVIPLMPGYAQDSGYDIVKGYDAARLEPDPLRELWTAVAEFGEEASIDSNNTGMNYSGQQNNTFSVVSSTPEQKMVFRFDIPNIITQYSSSFAANVALTISSASVTLQDATFTVRPILNPDIVEMDQVTWDNKDDSTPWVTPGIGSSDYVAGVSDVTTFAGTNNFVQDDSIEIDITNCIEYAAQNESNIVGFFIEMTSTTDTTFDIYSSNYTDGTDEQNSAYLRPFLTVTYLPALAPKSELLTWKAKPATPQANNAGSKGTFSDIIFNFDFNTDLNDIDSLSPSGTDLTASTSGSLSITALGPALSNPTLGVSISDPTILRLTDFTLAFVVRTPAVIGTQILAADANSGVTVNYRIFSNSDGSISVDAGNGAGLFDTFATSAGFLQPNTDYLIVAQREGQQVRIWAWNNGESFVYDPGGYEVTAPTGDNLGEDPIGIAPNDRATSWEPLVEGTQTSTPATPGSLSPKLFSFPNSSFPWTGFIYSAIGWSRALSYQEIAAMAFEPFRHERAWQQTINEDIENHQGIEWYRSLGYGPKIFFGVNDGTQSGGTDVMPVAIAEINSQGRVMRSAWRQQSGVNAPGVSLFIPQMGYNPANGPTDNRVTTDPGGNANAGLLSDHRKVSFRHSAFSTMNSTGVDTSLGLNLSQLVLDIETAAPGAAVESPKGYYPYFYVKETGLLFDDFRVDDRLFTPWWRPTLALESLTDLEEYAELEYINSDGYVHPFYLKYDDFENAGTDAVSRAHVALGFGDTNARAGLVGKTQTSRYLATQHNIPFAPAVRAQSAAWLRQDVFDVQMEVCMRASYQLAEDTEFLGIYIWGEGSEILEAAELLAFWMTEGEAAGLYTVEDPIDNPDQMGERMAPIYEDLAREYGNSADQLVMSVDSLFYALETVIAIDDPDVKIELLDAFRNVWDSTRIGTTRPLLSAVQRLNAFVVRRTQYNTVNSFLDGEGIQVSAAFAQLSADAGTPIDPLYVS